VVSEESPALEAAIVAGEEGTFVFRQLGEEDSVVNVTRGGLSVVATGQFCKDVRFAGGLAAIPSHCLPLTTVVLQAIVYSFDFGEPVFEIDDFVNLFGFASFSQSFVHTGFNPVTEFVISEMRVCTKKEGILSLDVDGVIMEGSVVLEHDKEFASGQVLPVTVKVTVADFRHEFGEGKFQETFTLVGDPVGDAGVFEGGEDFTDLFFGNNFFMVKIVKAGMFESAHDIRGDVTRVKNGRFGIGFVIEDGHVGDHDGRSQSRQ
jgi:hypothetical protein